MNQLHKSSLYASHLPILTRIMDITDGPVLELGMGLWSTPILDLMCRETGRELISFDNDPKWFESNKQWESDYHKFYFVEDWNEIFINRHWSVAFVDHRPAIRRIEEIKRLQKIANYIIIHDSEPEQDKFFKYSRIYDLFRYRLNYTKCKPHTTILSNFVDLTRINL